MAMSALIIVFYWWQSNSIDLELWLLDYDRWVFDAEVRTRNVPEGYKDYAEELLHAPTKNIGWPVRAGFGVMFLVFPYVTMFYALLGLWKVVSWARYKAKNQQNNR